MEQKRRETSKNFPTDITSKLKHEEELNMK